MKMTTFLSSDWGICEAQYEKIPGGCVQFSRQTISKRTHILPIPGKPDSVIPSIMLPIKMIFSLFRSENRIVSPPSPPPPHPIPPKKNTITNSSLYGQISPNGHLHNMDTSLLRTVHLAPMVR